MPVDVPPAIVQLLAGQPLHVRGDHRRIEPLAQRAAGLGGEVERPDLLALGYARDPLAALEAELLRTLDGMPEPDPVMNTAIRLLGSGTAGVAEVAARAYVSERQLERRFAERIGYGPKTFQRIMRFQRVAGQLRRGGVGLARAAASAGYADQAHLTRESRRLAGLSPRQLVSWMG